MKMELACCPDMMVNTLQYKGRKKSEAQQIGFLRPTSRHVSILFGGYLI
jgi:hypothetical protein